MGASRKFRRQAAKTEQKLVEEDFPIPDPSEVSFPDGYWDALSGDEQEILANMMEACAVYHDFTLSERAEAHWQAPEQIEAVREAALGLACASIGIRPSEFESLTSEQLKKRVLEKVGYPDAPGAGRSVSPELKDRQEALMRQAIDRHLLEGVPPVEAESGGEAMRMGPEFAEMMKLQLEAFRQKFGREPEPDEPIFFDEDADYPTPTPAIPREEFARAMLAGGIRPVVAYSFWKTGFIVNEVGYDNMSDQDRDELEDAGNEWLALSDAQQQRWLIDIKGS